MTNSNIVPMTTIKTDKPNTKTVQCDTGTFFVREDGIYHAGFSKDGTPLPERRLCAKLDVLASTCDEHSHNHGVLLKWKDNRNVTHQWAMPKALLAGETTDAVRPLYAGGLDIRAGRGTNQKIVEYIQSATPHDWLTCVNKTGWTHTVYVTAHKVYGADADNYILQSESITTSATNQTTTQGTLEDWQAHISRYAVGNDRLILAICAAFAGALKRFSDVSNVILHLHGNSTDGKTTAAKCAVSVLGSPENVQLWKATANGLETVATRYNDSLLVLDELRQASPKEVGDIVYMLGNGKGKVRATKQVTAREAVTWSVIGLSTGEITLSDYLKSEGKEIYAGQELRLLNIPSNAGAGLGIFSQLHGFNNSADLANHLNNSVSQYYGVAGDAWLDHLTRDADTLSNHVPIAITSFVESLGTISNQAKRAARAFGLLATAGELATSYGITTWEEGDATRACVALFGTWLDGFGTGNREDDQIYKAAVDFIQRNPNRFHLIFKPKSPDGKEIQGADYQLNQTQYLHNRVGFQKDGVYYVLPAQIKELAPQSSYDSKAILKVLKARGFFVGDTSKQLRVPTFSTQIKVWEVSGDVLNAE